MTSLTTNCLLSKIFYNSSIFTAGNKSRFLVYAAAVITIEIAGQVQRNETYKT